MRILLTVLLTLLLLPLPATAGKLAGVEMSDSATVAGEQLVLNGMALRKVMFFKVYVAGLYLPAQESSGDAILAADGVRHLEMHFLRNVEKQSLCDAWYEALAANYPDAGQAVKDQFDTLCEYMEEVDKGQSFRFTYQPGKGTTVEVKGASKGVLEGKPFADALFSSWIGPKPPPGEGFKKDLLGG